MRTDFADVYATASRESASGRLSSDGRSEVGHETARLGTRSAIWFSRACGRVRSLWVRPAFSEALVLEGRRGRALATTTAASLL